MMEHTPTPWFVGYGGNDGDDYAVITSPNRDRAICTLEPRDYIQANARFIVQSANSHEALVEACKAQKRLIEDMMRFVGQMALRDYQLLNEAPIMAAAALKLAGVK